MNVAEYLLKQLHAWGVERVYGVVGDAIFDLAGALARQDRLRFVACRHEAAAGFMAAAEAKLTGRPGVCVATAGPGIANLVAGLGDAYADRAPVLAITGHSPTDKIGTRYKQEIDQQRLLGALAAYTGLLAAPPALPHQLALAWRAAVMGGVGHISVPRDLWARPVSEPSGAEGAKGAHPEIRGPEPYLEAPPVPGEEVLAGALALLNAARRPVILAGHGALPAAAALVELAERWQAPVITSMVGKGVIPFRHPLALGGLGQGGYPEAAAALNEADLVLAVSSNWWPEPYVPRGASRPRLVRIDRDPANIGARSPVDYGLAGDVRTIVPRLQAGLRPETDPAWPERVAAWKGSLLQAWQAERDGEPGRKPGRDSGAAGLHPAQVMAALEEVLPEDAVLALDTGDHSVWFNRSFGGHRHRVLVSGTWRSLGFGLPAALAAKLAQPQRAVVALVGDGGLSALLGEVLTAVQHRLPVPVVVMNNGTYAMESNGMVRQGLQPLGTGLHNPDFAALARACGAGGRRVERPEELRPALQEALAGSGPTLVDVAVAPVPLPGPKS